MAEAPPPAGQESKVRTGCSSWTSDAWWGRVYPRTLADGDRLAWYARSWDTVEVDSSYYRDPGAFLVQRWARVTPEQFRFTMKFPRDLLDPKKGVRTEEISTFLGHVRQLGPKAGPVLLQFPPWVKPGRAEGFLDELLPRLEPDLRFAIELRDAGWFAGATFDRWRARLADRRLALAWSYLTYVDVPAVLTTDFVYLRFIADHTTVPESQHGELRVDRSATLAEWAERLGAHLEEISGGWVFFNNHFAGFAPESVNQFRIAMKLPPISYVRPGATTLDG